MKRTLFILAAALALILAAATLVTVVFATPVGQVRITYPYDGMQVTGVVPVRGTVNITSPEFAFYKIEVGLGEKPTEFGVVDGIQETAPKDDSLGKLDTTRLPNGPVVIKLTGVAKDANYLTDQVTVHVNNPPTTVGSQACAACHEDQYRAWAQTEHGARNIACETCHGPGGLHVATGGNTAFQGVVYAAGLCGTCHKDIEADWLKSAHNNIPDSAEFGRAICINCHSAQGYVKVNVQGETSFPVPAHLESQTCAACHDPHSAANPKQLRAVGQVKLPTGETVSAGLAANCEKCHNQRRDAADISNQVKNAFGRGPHEGTSSDMLNGVGAWEYEGKGYLFPSSPHKDVVKDQCVTCHMNPTAGQPVAHTFEPQLAACQTCHGASFTSFQVKAKADYDGNGKVGTVEEEIEGLMKLVEDQLPPMPYTFNRKLDTEAKRAAAYNVLFVERDRSKGVHNTLYAVALLQAAYKELTGKDVPNAALVIYKAAASAAPAAAAGGPPNIPPNHPTAGCNACHAQGVAGAPKFPENHVAYTETQCATCHKPQ